jgi:hypothetical protein
MIAMRWVLQPTQRGSVKSLTPDLRADEAVT